MSPCTSRLQSWSLVVVGMQHSHERSAHSHRFLGMD